MLYPVLAFVVTLALILGTYWLLVVYPEAKSKSSVTGRLRAFRVQSKQTTVTTGPPQMSAIPYLDAMLKGRGDLGTRLQRMLLEAGLKTSPGQFIAMTFFAASVGWAIGWFAIGLLVAGLGLALLFGALPYLVVRFKRSKRLRTFEEQFPEAIDLISRALRAGHAFTTGLDMVATEIPAPVGAEFRRVYDEQNFGMSLPDALRAMAVRVPVLDARFFVTAVITQRETGGNLSEVLDNLAHVMRERFKLKRQIRVISAHGQISAWVLSCLPPALAGVLFLLSPDFMSVLWTDPLGVRLVMLAVVLQVVGTIIISRMVRIEY